MTTSIEPSIYEQLAAKVPTVEGSSLVAIFDPDGHMIVCPVAAGLLDDEPMDEVVVDVFSDLLPGRRLSRQTSRKESPRKEMLAIRARLRAESPTRVSGCKWLLNLATAKTLFPEAEHSIGDEGYYDATPYLIVNSYEPFVLVDANGLRI